MTWTPPQSLPPVEEWLRDHEIQCLECGRWLRHLGHHLPTHGLNAESYRARWGMRQRQSLACRSYGRARREIAINTGGPERLESMREAVSPLAWERAKQREHRAQEVYSVVPAMVKRRVSNSSRRMEEIRSKTEADSGMPFDDWLRKAYLADGRTGASVAAELGVSESTVRKWLRDAGIEVRRRGPQPGKRRGGA